MVLLVVVVEQIWLFLSISLLKARVWKSPHFVMKATHALLKKEKKNMGKKDPALHYSSISFEEVEQRCKSWVGDGLDEL